MDTHGEIMSKIKNFLNYILALCLILLLIVVLSPLILAVLVLGVVIFVPLIIIVLPLYLLFLIFYDGEQLDDDNKINEHNR